MKNTLLAVAATLSLVACGGGGGGDAPANNIISPSDANAVADSLLVKVGDATAVQSTGDIPAASTSSTAPKVSTPAEISSSNGSTAQIPVTIDSTNTNPLTALFMKVTGSDSVFEVDVSATSTKAWMAEQDMVKSASGTKDLNPGSTSNLEVTLPSGLQPGEFNVQISGRDNQGQVAEIATTKIAVARVGTGALQFSLSWDAPVDIDLYVTEPNGNRIAYFNSGPSETGGQLDFDDTDGTGPSRISESAPNAVENIFWENTAPSGQYVVEVAYFSGSVPTNFTVTISRNGTLVETRSVNNFSSGTVEVTRINN